MKIYKNYHYKLCTLPVILPKANGTSLLNEDIHQLSLEIIDITRNSSKILQKSYRNSTQSPWC